MFMKQENQLASCRKLRFFKFYDIVIHLKAVVTPTILPVQLLKADSCLFSFPKLFNREIIFSVLKIANTYSRRMHTKRKLLFSSFSESNFQCILQGKYKIPLFESIDSFLMLCSNWSLYPSYIYTCCFCRSYKPGTWK